MATRVGLTKTAVLQTAAALADTVGLESLTLSSLAERLGVRTPTLYHYLPQGVAELQRELALQSMRDQLDQLGRAIMGKSGASALWALAETYRKYIKVHPGLYASTTMRATTKDDPDLQAAHTAVFEVAMHAIEGYHLADEDAIHAIRMLRIIVHGTATLEVGSGFGLPQDIDETFRRAFTAYLTSLDALKS